MVMVKDMIAAQERPRSTNIDVMMGDVLRDKRLWVGLTQQQLAEKTGVSFQQIQKYETGANRVSISRLFLIAAALNMKPSDLITEVEDLSSLQTTEGDPEAQNPHQFAKTRTARRVIRGLASIHDKDLLLALANLISTLENERRQS